jgi:polar amino acid transport system substrate-binding protein
VINFPFRLRPARRRALLVAVLGLVLTLVLPWLGCQTAPPAGTGHPANAECLHRIIESGELRVGMTGSQAPLNMRNRNGDLIGLDVELARALADAMRVELILVETPFAELLSDIEKGKIDLAISSMTITPRRNARVAFAGPYMISGLSLLTRSDLVGQLTDVASLNSADRGWGALEGSTGEELISDVFPMARYVVIESQEAAIEMIASGEIDGLVADHPSVEFAIARNPDLELASLPSPLTTEPLGIALPANSPLFANLVQNYVNTLDYTGQLMQMKARWLNGGDWLLEMP